MALINPPNAGPYVVVTSWCADPASEKLQQNTVLGVDYIDGFVACACHDDEGSLDIKTVPATLYMEPSNQTRWLVAYWDNPKLPDTVVLRQLSARGRVGPLVELVKTISCLPKTKGAGRDYA